MRAGRGVVTGLEGCGHTPMATSVSRNRLSKEGSGGAINLVESGDHSENNGKDTTLGIESNQQPKLRNTPIYRRLDGINDHYPRGSRFSLRRSMELEDKQPRRSFCRSWCEMWFLLAQSKITCIGLSLVLIGGGILLILLTIFSGLMKCQALNGQALSGAAVFCFLVSALSLSLGLLCCSYHWVKDDDDLPFAIFCVAYCLLLLFIFITIAGTVVVFTRIHPIGHLQPPPISNGTKVSIAPSDVKCDMIELPLGVLIICYCLSLGFVIMSYMACIMALGATSDIPPL